MEIQQTDGLDRCNRQALCQPEQHILFFKHIRHLLMFCSTRAKKARGFRSRSGPQTSKRICCRTGTSAMVLIKTAKRRLVEKETRNVEHYRLFSEGKISYNVTQVDAKVNCFGKLQSIT
jgi:hypothetical protein